jgi:hypothetical protein
MAYVDYEYFKSLYGEDKLTETDFNRLSWDAEREIDKATSGVDNVRKLKVAFPTNEEDAETVKRCVCALIEFLNNLETVEKSSVMVQGSDGTMRGGIIKSVSAGNESITYETSGTVSNANRSVKDRDLTVYAFIASRLSGVSDANGVNLLFGGRYPYRVEA